MIEFLLGLGLGQSLVSSGTKTVETIDDRHPENVFINGPALVRVRDPLTIRLATSGWSDLWNKESNHPSSGTTYLAMFQSLLTPFELKAEDFEVLRITRILSHENCHVAFWFEFIEKHLLIQPE